jgi:peptidoglycan/LPS O-acetylase OafA/YrhL
LEALTSLRFFAAACIVFVHLPAQITCLPDLTLGGHFPLHQSVSLFFVLSGFILAYVYPRLNSAAECGRFWLARFARIWPCHAFALSLLMLISHLSPVDLYHSDGGSGTLTQWLANLFMVHAWIPVQGFFLRWNFPAWSISTEFGFYLLFPMLVLGFKRTWHVKLVACLLLVAGLMKLGHVYQIPSNSEKSVSMQVLFYFHPLGRLLEFVLGMTTAHFWCTTVARIRLGRYLGTLVELAAITLVAVNLYYSMPMALWVMKSLELTYGDMPWLPHGCVCLSFALLIFVVALEQGYISRLLCLPVFVFLGEISYAIYLLHAVLSTYMFNNARLFAGYPNWLLFVGFVATLLALSHLTWMLVEKPARKFLVGLWPRHATIATPSVSAGSLSIGRLLQRLTPTPAGLILGVELLLVGTVIYACERRPYRVLSDATAEVLELCSLPELRNIHFGNRYLLRGVQLIPTKRGLKVELLWQSCQEQELDCYVVLHFCDKAEQTLGDAGYKQDVHQRWVKEGTVWLEKTIIPYSKIQDWAEKGGTRIGIGIVPLKDKRWVMLPIDHGPLDIGHVRVMVPLPS